jgi:zinc protease
MSSIVVQLTNRMSKGQKRMIFLALSALLFSSMALVAAETAAVKTNESPATVLQPSSSPLVTFRILFMTGAAYDPEGKEGLAALTAAMLAEGGSQKLAYDEILKQMYPLATRFDAQVDKEMTVFEGTTHVDNLDKYYQLIRGMILKPGFREDDFKRLKENALNFLKVSLREGNDEELGKEELYNLIYKDSPYGHHNIGTITSLEKLTLRDVRNFYLSNYTRANLVIGLAGGYPENFPGKVQADFASLPTGDRNDQKFSAPRLESGMHIEIIQRDTRSTAFSLGFPIDVKRGDPDYPALALVASYFGQHRSSNSHLYQQLREARGLNYGDYSYIEYFPRGMFQFQPDPNLARQQQIFQIWIRPVPPPQGLFTLRATLFEYDKLIKEGLTKEEFESTREFLSKFVDVLLQTQSASLGYALDSRYYGISDYRDYMKKGLADLTLDQVNQALRKHLKTDSMRVVVVARDAEAFRDAILSGKPSPITYNSAKPDDILAEDKVIEKYEIPTKEEWVTIKPVEQVFQ